MLDGIISTYYKTNVKKQQAREMVAFERRKGKT